MIQQFGVESSGVCVCVQQEVVCGLCVHMMAAVQHYITPLTEHFKYLKKQVPAAKTSHFIKHYDEITQNMTCHIINLFILTKRKL